MKKNIVKNISVALTLCLAMLAAETTLAQQGKGNPNKNTPPGTENEEVRKEKQQGRSEENKARQNKGNDKSKKDYDKRDEAKAKADKGKRNEGREWEVDKDDKDNKGNAYGRDKEGLSGREFGQQRAADARMTGEQRRRELGRTVEDGDKKVRDANERIARAREELEKNRKAKKISDAEYNERKNRIERAEKAVKVLEERVEAGRQLSINVSY